MIRRDAARRTTSRPSPGSPRLRRPRRPRARRTARLEQGDAQPSRTRRPHVQHGRAQAHRRRDGRAPWLPRGRLSGGIPKWRPCAHRTSRSGDEPCGRPPATTARASRDTRYGSSWATSGRRSLSIRPTSRNTSNPDNGRSCPSINRRERDTVLSSKLGTLRLRSPSERPTCRVLDANVQKLRASRRHLVAVLGSGPHPNVVVPPARGDLAEGTCSSERAAPLGLAAGIQSVANSVIVLTSVLARSHYAASEWAA